MQLGLTFQAICLVSLLHLNGYFLPSVLLKLRRSAEFDVIRARLFFLFGVKYGLLDRCLFDTKKIESNIK